MKTYCLLAVACLVLFLSGCGPKLATVEGKVTHDGKPVKGGSIGFAPEEEGKPAAGTVNEDGTFVLNTFGGNDGAMVGSHTVTYSAPDFDEDDEGAAELAHLKGLVPKESKVEVAAGKNEITIELVESSAE